MFYFFILILRIHPVIRSVTAGPRSGSLLNKLGNRMSSFLNDFVCLQYWSVISLNNSETWTEFVVHHWMEQWFTVSRLFSLELESDKYRLRAAVICITLLFSRSINWFCMQQGSVWPCLDSGVSEFIVLFPQGVSKLTSLELHSHCPRLGSQLQTQRDTEAFQNPCKFLWETDSGSQNQQEATLLLRWCRNIASDILACGVGGDVLLIPGYMHMHIYLYFHLFCCRAQWDQHSNSHELLR